MRRGARYPGPVAVGVLGANRAVYAKALGCAPDEITERWAAGPQELHRAAPRRRRPRDGGDPRRRRRARARRHPRVPAPHLDAGVRPGAVLHLAVLGDQGPGDRRPQRRYLPGHGEGGGQGRHDGPPEPAHRPAPAERARPGKIARGGHHPRLHARRSGSAAWPRSRSASTSTPSPAASPASPSSSSSAGPSTSRCRRRAEIVIEGYVDPTYREQEAPFGEYTGYMGTRVANPVFHVTGDHASQEAGVPGVPQPVPAVGEQPHPQAGLRRGLSQAPARGQHPRRARRAAARGHRQLRAHGHPAQEGAPVAAVAGAARGRRPRPDDRQDDRRRRRRHRPERRRRGELGDGLPHAAAPRHAHRDRQGVASSTRRRRRRRRTSTSSASRSRWAPRRSSSTPRASGTTRRPRCRARSSWRRRSSAGRRRACRR